MLGVPACPGRPEFVLPGMIEAIGEGLDGAPCCGKPRANASEQQLALVGEPAGEQQVEGVSEPAAGIKTALAVEGIDLGGGALALPLSLAFGALPSALAACLLGDAVQDAGEVAVAGSCEAAASAIAEASFGLADVLEGMELVSADEAGERAEHLVALVNVGEEEPLGAPFGVRAFALVFDEVAELLGIGTGEGMNEIRAALVVDLKESIDEQLRQGASQRGLGQLR